MNSLESVATVGIWLGLLTSKNTQGDSERSLAQESYTKDELGKDLFALARIRSMQGKYGGIF